jgi:hypothetical protein
MLSTYLISTAITPTKIIVAVVLLVVIAGGAFFWMRSRNSAA